MKQREIKFRAWDGEKMFEVYTLTMGKKLTSARPYEGTRALKICDPYPLMQFTDLKDKNGKDIYEGDRVRYDGQNKGSTYTVKFDSGVFFLDHDEDDSLKLPSPPYPKYFEVVGNIYETP